MMFKFSIAKRRFAAVAVGVLWVPLGCSVDAAEAPVDATGQQTAAFSVAACSTDAECNGRCFDCGADFTCMGGQGQCIEGSCVFPDGQDYWCLPPPPPPICEAGWDLCGETDCVNLRSDPLNCGGCGTICNDGVCRDGMCV